MKIIDAIRWADSFYPNTYILDEKLAWCYELTCDIYENYLRPYQAEDFTGISATDGVFTGGEGDELPPTVWPENVEAVYVDGVRYDKTDDRSFEDIDLTKGTIRVVYKLRPEPYAPAEVEGATVGTKIRDGVEYGTITAPYGAFDIGDAAVLEYTKDGNTQWQEQYVLDFEDTEGTEANLVYFFSHVFEADEGRVLRPLQDETPMPAPYDSMYIDYLLGKIAYYQNDLSEYNKQMGQFNTKLDAYAKWLRRTGPVEYGIRFRHKF